MRSWARNRVVIGLALFLTAMTVWEFALKPQFRPMYEHGLVLYQRGRYEEALREFGRAYEVAPNEIEVIVMMGWSNLRLRRLEEAGFYFHRAERIDPRNLEAQVGSAYVTLARGKKPDRAKVERLARKHPGNADLQELLKATK